MRYIIIAIFLVSIVSCKSQNNNLKSNQTVISAEPKMDWLFGKNYKNWSPADNDIETAEKLFQQGFDNQKKGMGNKFEDRLEGRTTDEYNMQFVGAIDENGDKIIWVNCFCKKEKDSFKKWKDEIVHVSDGGNCFINVKVNITKNTYTDFMVNGNA